VFAYKLEEMSAPLVPSPLDYIGRRKFAFYPPIRHAAPNIWMLGSGSWSEVQIINSHTGRELWVPRQYIGAVSDHEDSLVVGLTHQLELRLDKIVPRSNRRILQMPAPTKTNAAAASHQNGPARVVGIRLEGKSPTVFQRAPFRVGIFVLFVAGLLALIASTSHVK
jgi:hypothetical protein